MNLLAIDTSTRYLSLAVMKDGKVVKRFHRRADMRHSSILIPTIEKVLKDAHLSPKGLDGFCISIGPGSFTGLRIGVATVKALAYALGKPVAAVPTFDVIAENAKAFEGIICPVLDARKNKVYACIYESDGKKIKRVSGYLLLSSDELKKKLKGYKTVTFLGDGVKFIREDGDSIEDWYPRADVLLRIGAEYFRKGKFTKSGELQPLYLYSKECDITGW